MLIECESARFHRPDAFGVFDNQCGAALVLGSVDVVRK